MCFVSCYVSCVITMCNGKIDRDKLNKQSNSESTLTAQ